MSPAPLHARSRAAGFTLIELMISATLMALILGAAYACLTAGLSAQRLVDPRLEATQTARVALALLTADLRAACVLDRNAEFIGQQRKLGDLDAGNLDFATLNQTPRRPGEGGYCQTSYFLDRDPATGEVILWRRRNPRIGLDPFSGGAREEIARGIRQLKFEYYDGFDWYDSWGDPDNRTRDREVPKTSSRLEPNLSGLPEAVRITLAVETDRSRRSGHSASSGADSADDSGESGEAPLVFQTVARIVVPSAAGAGGSASSGNATSPAGGPSSPVPN